MRPAVHSGARAAVRVAVVCALASLAAFGADAVPALDLASHFRVQYLWALVPAIALASVLRARGAAVLMGAVALAHAAVVVQAARPVPDARRATGAPLRVVTSNLLATNRDHAAQVRWLDAVDPDVVVFQEYTPAWHGTLADALPGLPHRRGVPIDSPFGIALYSRWPIVRAQTMAFDRKRVPSLRLALDVDGTRLVVLATHPPPPLGTLRGSSERHLRALADAAAGTDGPLLVAGDLNVTPWSAAFRELVRRPGLVDARRGHGVLATWSPSTAVRGAAAALLRSAPASLPIDHVLTGGGVDVEGAFVGPPTGSDHRALVVDLRLP